MALPEHFRLDLRTGKKRIPAGASDQSVATAIGKEKAVTVDLQCGRVDKFYSQMQK
ncbi:MAG: hypothetical protein ACLR6J_03100 [Parabacteroides merdae]